jgi:hypothetical protein
MSQLRIAQDDGAVPRFSDTAGRKRTVVGQHRLAEQRLGDRGAELVCELGDLVTGRQRALPREDRDTRARVKDGGGGLQLIRWRRRQGRAP